jgi:hypothetical protein
MRHSEFRVFFTLQTEAWTRFCEMGVPFDAFHGEQIGALIAHWTDKMEEPWEDDTPLFDTDQ